jgi:hypothetical protein
MDLPKTNKKPRVVTPGSSANTKTSIFNYENTKTKRFKDMSFHPTNKVSERSDDLAKTARCPNVQFSDWRNVRSVVIPKLNKLHLCRNVPSLPVKEFKDFSFAHCNTLQVRHEL